MKLGQGGGKRKVQFRAQCADWLEHHQPKLSGAGLLFPGVNIWLTISVKNRMICLSRYLPCTEITSNFAPICMRESEPRAIVPRWGMIPKPQAERRDYDKAGQQGTSSCQICIRQACKHHPSPVTAGRTLSTLTSGPRHPILSQAWAGRSFLAFLQPTELQLTWA